MKPNFSFNRTRSSRSRSCHRGYLLLDMLIVMMLTVVVLSTTSVWMFKTIRYTADVSKRDSHSRNISRISRQLRSDARAAKSIAVNANTLKITTESGTSIEYLIEASKIHRHVSGGDRDHHDDFLFIDNAKLAWTSQATSETAALEIRRDFSQMSASKTKPSKGLDARIVIRTAMEVSK